MNHEKSKLHQRDQPKPTIKEVEKTNPKKADLQKSNLKKIEKTNPLEVDLPIKNEAPKSDDLDDLSLRPLEPVSPSLLGKIIKPSNITSISSYCDEDWVD